MNDEYDKSENQPVEDWAMSDPQIQPETKTGTDNFDITLVGMKPPTAVATTEDWAMNVPKTNPAIEKDSDGWEMPPPIFRISSGRKLDKANRKTPRLPSPDLSPVQEQSSPTAALPNLEIQPQPYISEEFSVSEAVAEPSAKAKTNGSKLMFLIIGLLAMLLFAIAFVAGIYFWFFKPVT